MTRFIDQYLPACTNSFGAVGAPRFNNVVATVDSGDESPNRRWAKAKWRFIIPAAVRELPLPHQLTAHFLIMGADAQTFPFTDPLDCASVDVIRPGEYPTISATDQVIATGDGVTSTFQLIKTYQYGDQSYVRNITLPQIDSVVISVNDVEIEESSTTWSVDRETGIVSFDSPPADAAVIKAGYYFDIPVRYESDNVLEVLAAGVKSAGYADLPLLEVRPC